jgi:hypothetical protein
MAAELTWRFKKVRLWPTDIYFDDFEFETLELAW